MVAKHIIPQSRGNKRLRVVQSHMVVKPSSEVKRRYNGLRVVQSQQGV